MVAVIGQVIQVTVSVTTYWPGAIGRYYLNRDTNIQFTGKRVEKGDLFHVVGLILH
jgi:hypothetical protein